jgi:ribosomal protein L11 methyltransferase
VVVDGADAERIADLLWLHGATAVGERPLGALVELEAGFVTPDEAAAAVAALGLPSAEVVDAGPALDAALDAWMAHARPVRVGRLHVRPSWLDEDDEAPAVGERVVVLDPSRAFGSGSHPSTVACLAAVDRYVQRGSAVLDIGCGTGVLAVAAAVLGATPVAAVDIDPVAVSATAANGARNGVEVGVAVGSADDVEGRFDLVLANIGAGAALALAPALAARCAPGGRVVVAGLYVDRADEIASGLDAVGLMVEDRSVVDGWACLIHHSPIAIQHTVAAASEDDQQRGAR